MSFAAGTGTGVAPFWLSQARKSAFSPCSPLFGEGIRCGNWHTGAGVAALKLFSFAAHHLGREQAVWQELLSC